MADLLGGWRRDRFLDRGLSTVFCERAVVLVLGYCLQSLPASDLEKMGRLYRSIGEAITMPINSRGEEVSRGVRVVERRNPTRGGITQGRFYNVTEHWVREFFESPGRHLQDLLGMDISCLASKSCLAVADEQLKQHRAEWRASGERGKILVGLTYVLGESILLDRSELDWVVVVEDEFIDDIGLAKGDAMVGLFSRLASLKTFVLGEDGIDLVTWKGFLASESLSEIDQEVPTMTFTIRK